MDGWMLSVCAGASDEANGESRLLALSLSVYQAISCSCCLFRWRLKVNDWDLHT